MTVGEKSGATDTVSSLQVTDCLYIILGKGTLQSEFAKAQMAAMQTQAKELGAVAQDAIASATRK